ncbi:MAG: hypothetical protein WA913_03210 [Pricia sp.]
MVLIFKTSVSKRNELRRLRPLLNRILNGDGKWNFDLEDCDNILRVETKEVGSVAVSSLLRIHGFYCEEL